MTTKNTTTTTTHAMPAATLKALLVRVTTLSTVEREGSHSVEDARWSAFNSKVDAMSALGSFVTDNIVPKILNGATDSGKAIREALAREDSGVYVADADVRNQLPKATVLDEAMDVATLDSVQRRAAYRSAENAPRVRDFIAWAKIDAGVKLGGKSSVDVSATKASAAKVAKGEHKFPGKLVREASTTTTSKITTTATPPRLGMFSDLLADGVDLQAVIDASPIDVEATFASFSADDRRAVCKALCAMLVRDEESDKRNVELITR